MRRYRGFDRSIRAGIVQTLLDRDGPNCGICETALDHSAGPDHPVSTTIDHIVPMSEGGEFGHETAIENLRLAHSFCNTKFARCPDFRAAWFASELRRAITRWNEKLTLLGGAAFPRGCLRRATSLPRQSLAGKARTD